MDAFIGYSGNKPFSFPLKKLRKHFFALGSSGSGKTVLSKVIIEELALNGIPVIAVDPQGDLASLALAGDPKDLEEHGLDPETAKKFKETVRVNIYTPISSKGIPISLNPLDIGKLDAPEEELIPILHQIASSITKLLGYITTNDKGKAAETILYTILKDSHDKGTIISNFSDLAELIKNIPEDLKDELHEFISNEKEFDQLIRKIRYMTVGEKELLFNFGTPLDIASLLAKQDGRTTISIIYLNTLTNQEEKEFFVSILTTRLYQWMLQNPSESLSCGYFIDEIAPFIPAGSEKPIPKPILKMLFKQARKYGVACLIATQNPGDIDYKAFAQFGSWAIGRLTVKQDQKKVENALKSLTAENFTEKLPALKPGNFILFSPDISKRLLEIKVRWLYTVHKTMTDIDIKRITGGSSVKLKKHKASRQNKPVSGQKEQKNQVSKVPHFPLREIDISEIARKNTKRFMMIGPRTEEITKIRLNLWPIHNIEVSGEDGFFSKNSIYWLLVDAINGSLLIFKKHGFDQFPDLGKLIGMKENEVKILKVLEKKMKKEEILKKTSLPKAAVTRGLNGLLSKGMVRYVQESYETQLDLPKEIAKVRSEKPDTTHKPTETAIPLKPKIGLKEIENTIRIWLDAAVIRSEIIHLPVYEIIYEGSKGKRRVLVNGYNGKQIPI